MREESIKRQEAVNEQIASSDKSSSSESSMSQLNLAEPRSKSENVLIDPPEQDARALIGSQTTQRKAKVLSWTRSAPNEYLHSRHTSYRRDRNEHPVDEEPTRSHAQGSQASQAYQFEERRFKTSSVARERIEIVLRKNENLPGHMHYIGFETNMSLFLQFILFM